MIIRKPYAFLIKNFKKIHIFLLILSIYVAYKLVDVSGFVVEFMKFGTYDFFKDPITKHINFLMIFSTIMLIVGSLSLAILLRYKKKPYKLYLIPTLIYLVLLFVLNMVKGFFNIYSIDVETTDLRLSRDLLIIFLIVQMPAIYIYIMRVFGLDISKFEFNSSTEYLQLSEEDREEVEINVSFDKNTLKRVFKRFTRNVNYIYQEHKLICKIIISLIFFVVAFGMYKSIFVTNKVYKQGQYYNANGYTIKINNAYFTDKDYKGDVITSKSNFVIIDLSIKNNYSTRKINLENFHLKNATEDYVTTNKVYSLEFNDLGITYDNVKELKNEETLNCIIVYKVSNKLKKNKFVLYYQELNDNNKLRKIKLNLNDLRNISQDTNLSLGDDIVVSNGAKQENVSFDYYTITDSITYSTRSCNSMGCSNSNEIFSTDGSYKILEIDFSSDEMGAKNMIDFLDKYGRIIYKDSSGTEEEIKVKNPISKQYYGKVVFISVPNEISNASEIKFKFVIRNKSYIYKLT